MENKGKIKQYLPLVIIVNTCCGATCICKIWSTPTHLYSHNPRAVKEEAVEVCKTWLTTMGSEKEPTLRIDDPRRFEAIKDNVLHLCHRAQQQARSACIQKSDVVDWDSDIKWHQYAWVQAVALKDIVQRNHIYIDTTLYSLLYFQKSY